MACDMTEKKSAKELAKPLTAPDAIVSVAQEGAAVLQKEVAQRQEAQLQLERTARVWALEEICSRLAHELNNILGVIMSYSSYLHQSQGISHGVREDLETILRASDRGCDLVQQLSQFSQRHNALPVTIELNKMIAGTESLLRRIAGENIAVETRLHGDPCLAYIDPARLEQVLTNLTIYTREAVKDCFIEIEVCQETIAGTICNVIRFSGTGHEIPRKRFEEIFDPFVTVKKKGNKVDLGLGLATCRGIIENAGGTLVVERSSSHGTTYKITLPLQ